MPNPLVQYRARKRGGGLAVYKLRKHSPPRKLKYYGGVFLKNGGGVKKKYRFLTKTQIIECYGNYIKKLCFFYV